MAHQLIYLNIHQGSPNNKQLMYAVRLFGLFVESGQLGQGNVLVICIEKKYLNLRSHFDTYTKKQCMYQDCSWLNYFQLFGNIYSLTRILNVKIIIYSIYCTVYSIFNAWKSEEGE